MSSRTLDLTEPVYRYLVEHSVRDTEALRALREETAGLKQAVMQISPEQGHFMQVLVKMLGARRTIEVGVFTGYSALNVALALPDDGRVLACDVNADWTAIGRRHWERAGIAHKIELVLAPALETLDARIAAGEAGQYDFAFIDADKANYGGYYERCLTLLRAGGVIAIDNTLWGGDVADASVDDADTRAIRAVNDTVHGDVRVDAAMLPIGDGLTLARKR